MKRFLSHRGAVLAAVLLMLVAISTPAFAQRFGGTAWDSRLYYSAQLLGPTNPLQAPDSEYTGIPVAGWMLYANILGSAIYDDNIYQTSTDETASWGFRVQPALAAVRNTGIHNTMLYGFADVRFYNEGDADVFNSLAGVSHVWEIQRDTVLRLNADIGRQTDITNGGVVETVDGAQTVADPLTLNQFSAGGSFYKSFDFLYFALGGNMTGTSYNDLTTSEGLDIDQSYRNQMVYSLTERAGVFLTPVLYAFVEPTQNWRRFNDDAFNSAGQRVVGGLGTDRISLFRGEVFAGYQWQDYDNPAFGDISDAVFGGRLYWYPLRELTFDLKVDRSIGDSTLFTPGNAAGSPVEDTGIALRADYVVTDLWSLAGKLGYDYVDYTATPRRDNQWLLGTTISYFIWRDLALTFDYQHIALDSNFSVNSFNRNMYTLGGTYKF